MHSLSTLADVISCHDFCLFTVLFSQGQQSFILLEIKATQWSFWQNGKQKYICRVSVRKGRILMKQLPKCSEFRAQICMYNRGTVVTSHGSNSK